MAIPLKEWNGVTRQVKSEHPDASAYHQFSSSITASVRRDWTRYHKLRDALNHYNSL